MSPSRFAVPLSTDNRTTAFLQAAVGVYHSQRYAPSDSVVSQPMFGSMFALQAAHIAGYALLVEPGLGTDCRFSCPYRVVWVRCLRDVGRVETRSGHEVVGVDEDLNSYVKFVEGLGGVDQYDAVPEAVAPNPRVEFSPFLVVDLGR